LRRCRQAALCGGEPAREAACHSGSAELSDSIGSYYRQNIED
jgi:hypothetical protein